MLQDVMRVWLALLQISQHDFTMLQVVVLKYCVRWTGVLVDLDPLFQIRRRLWTPPSKSVSGFGPPSADLDPPTGQM